MAPQRRLIRREGDPRGLHLRVDSPSVVMDGPVWGAADWAVARPR
jgi:hypothetical protein